MQDKWGPGSVCVCGILAHIWGSRQSLPRLQPCTQHAPMLPRVRAPPPYRPRSPARTSTSWHAKHQVNVSVNEQMSALQLLIACCQYTKGWSVPFCFPHLKPSCSIFLLSSSSAYIALKTNQAMLGLLPGPSLTGSSSTLVNILPFHLPLCHRRATDEDGG